MGISLKFYAWLFTNLDVPPSSFELLLRCANVTIRVLEINDLH